MSKVSVFVPCLVDLFLPEIAEATFAVLEHLGLDPVYHDEQTCCGQPAINSGYTGQARKSAKHFIEIFENDDVIVSPSGSCVHTVRFHYPNLLRDEPEWLARAEALASRSYELSQYIVEVLNVQDMGGAFKGKVTYHASCQLRLGLGISAQPLKLIEAVEGTELVPLDSAEKCCGFGGSFSKDYPEISEAMVREKAENYVASGADVLVTCDPGCLLNIGGYLSRNHPDKKVMHIAGFLADAVKDSQR